MKPKKWFHIVEICVIPYWFQKYSSISYSFICKILILLLLWTRLFLHARDKTVKDIWETLILWTEILTKTYFESDGNNCYEESQGEKGIGDMCVHVRVQSLWAGINMYCVGRSVRWPCGWSSVGRERARRYCCTEAGYSRPF